MIFFCGKLVGTETVVRKPNPPNTHCNQNGGRNLHAEPNADAWRWKTNITNWHHSTWNFSTIQLFRPSLVSVKVTSLGFLYFIFLYSFFCHVFLPFLEISTGWRKSWKSFIIRATKIQSPSHRMGRAGRRAGGQVGRQGGRETEFGRQIRDGVPEYRGKQVRGFRRGAHDTGANERSAKLLNGCFLISVVERWRANPRHVVLTGILG